MFDAINDFDLYKPKYQPANLLRDMCDAIQLYSQQLLMAEQSNAQPYIAFVYQESHQLHVKLFYKL